MVKAGSWVEIEAVLLAPQERADNLPDDTRATPYVLRVSGFLAADAELGEQVVVRSIIGREHHGTLRVANPGYTHSFGETVPELLRIGIDEGRTT